MLHRFVYHQEVLILIQLHQLPAMVHHGADEFSPSVDIGQWLDFALLLPQQQLENDPRNLLVIALSIQKQNCGPQGLLFLAPLIAVHCVLLFLVAIPRDGEEGQHHPEVVIVVRQPNVPLLQYLQNLLPMWQDNALMLDYLGRGY